MAQFRFRYGAHAHGHESYLDYVRMKDYLHAHEDDEKEALLPSPSPYTNQTAFWDMFSEEINRVNKSYMISMGEINEYLNDMQELAGSFISDKSRSKKLRKVQETFLKRIATVLHTKITKLEDFRLLNRTAALKILNKYDKIVSKKQKKDKEGSRTSVLASYVQRMDTLEFGHGESLVVAKNNLEELYCTMFCDGVMEEAHLKLSLSKTTISPELMQMVAGKIGIILALLVWLFNNFIISPRLSMVYLLRDDPAWCVYATVGALIVYRWFWGFCVYMWDNARVDYMLVLSLDPNKHMLHCVDIYSDAANLTILYLINMLVFHIMRYYYTHTGHDVEDQLTHSFSRYAWLMPLFLIIGTLARLVHSWVQPISYGVFSSAVFYRMFRAPFMKVLLRDNIAASILCSFSKVLAGVLFSGCYFWSGAFLYTADPNHNASRERFHECTHGHTIRAFQVLFYIIPLTVRMLQCLRMLYDLKYTPWTQPPHNTTVDYNQQTSLDPSQDPTIEYGYTWFSPMMEQFGEVEEGVLGDLSEEVHGGASSMRAVEEGNSTSSTNTITNTNTNANTNHTNYTNYNTNDTNTSHSPHNTLTPQQTLQQTLPQSLQHTLPLAPHPLQQEYEQEIAEHTTTADPLVVGLEVLGLRSRSRSSSAAQRVVDSGESGTSGDTSAASGSGSSGGEVSAKLHTATLNNTRSNTKNTSDKNTMSDVEYGSTAYNPFHSSVHDPSSINTNTNTNTDSEYTTLDSTAFHSAHAHAHTRSVHSFVVTARRMCTGPLQLLNPLYTLCRRYFDPLYAGFKSVWLWPHAMNAFQYLLQIMVVLIGAFPPQDPSSAAYITCLTLFVLFTVVFLSYWDIVVDCQLMRFDSEKPLLRKKLYYEEYEYFYYVFIFLNPVFRLLWVLSFTPFGSHPAFMLFEIVRRSFWAVLRMEVAYVQELTRRRSN